LDFSGGSGTLASYPYFHIHRIMSEIIRCHWAATEPNLSYHDSEWGVPLHDDRRLFEFLILE
jgi:hypothetical protein